MKNASISDISVSISGFEKWEDMTWLVCPPKREIVTHISNISIKWFSVIFLPVEIPSIDFKNAKSNVNQDTKFFSKIKFIFNFSLCVVKYDKLAQKYSRLQNKTLN